LTASGRFDALAVTCEAGASYPTDPATAAEAIMGDIALRAEIALAPELRPPPLSGAKTSSSW